MWIRIGFNGDRDPDPAFYFNVDPDPAFYLDADPASGSLTNLNPCGSGSGSWSEFKITKVELHKNLGT
jgi:hypothetical protein